MVKKKNIMGYIFYFIILLIEYRFFFLFYFPDSVQRMMTYHNKIGLLFIVIIFFSCFGIYKQKIEFTFSVVLYLIWILISATYSLFVYSPNSSEILIPLAAYCLIILYFPLRAFFKENIDSALKILTWFNILACLLLLIQYIIYDFNGNIFMNIYEFYRSGEIATRDNHIRITYLGTMISLSATISSGVLFSKAKNKNIHLINILLSMLYFFYVSQTRMYVFSLLAVLILQFNMIRKNSGNKYITSIIWFFLVLIVFFGLGLDEYVMAILNPIIDGSYLDNGSYYARLDALNYFSSVITKNPFMGNGLLKPEMTSSYYSIVHSISGNATYSDVGILGLTAQFGVPMLVWFIVLLRHMHKIVKETSDYVLNSIFLFIIFSSLTLIVLDPQRIMFLAFSLAIFDIKKKEYIKLNET